MRTDRELLELAAEASGYNWQNVTKSMFLGETELRDWPYAWNPLLYNEDAFALAVHLQIQITPGTYNKDEFTAFCPGCNAEAHERRNPSDNEDACSATRRVIVRAAAAKAYWVKNNG